IERNHMSEQIWTIKKVLDWSASHFHKKGLENARLNAEWLLGEVLQLDRVRLYLNFDKILNKDELAAFRSMIEKRLEHKPLQYILGHYDFMGIDLLLNENVLIPRPETELLAETAIEHFKRKRTEIKVLEIGVGSGCIPVALNKYLKSTVHYDGFEISSGAADLANENFKKHELPEEYKIINHNFLTPLPSEFENKKFDLIISNPPYVTEEEWLELQPEVKEHEPKTALVAVHEDPLIFYKKISKLKDKLNKNGMILVEMSFTFWKEIKTFFINAGFEVEIIQDYSQRERVLLARL
ncbi:MAG: peptide chain release factor N(5)-glutamine methyltransferase, partial [Calditrichia bacterium]|nr:peptide chain release factor N(5)-glutamine methyltransferase [Calditrichia bacterium]